MANCCVLSRSLNLYSLSRKHLLFLIITLWCVFHLVNSTFDKTDKSASPSSPEFLGTVATEDVNSAFNLPETVDASDIKNIETSEKLQASENGADVRPEDLSFEKLYEQGVRAYSDQLWYSCANKIEKAVKDYKTYKQTMSNCRLDCSKGVRTSQLSNLSSSFHDFSIFAKLLKDAHCFRRCKDESLSAHPWLTERVTKEFERRAPYQYLQYCYFKLDRLQLAASAAYTFFLVNPNDTDTIDNIAFYRDKAKVADSDFVDLEIVPYKEHYIRGMLAFSNAEWGSAVFHLEGCLDEYFQEHEKCLADCEGNIKKTGAMLRIGVADMVINILKCKLNCEEKLSYIYTEPIKFFLQDIYHHIQFAYYKDGDLEKSAEATAAFLVINSSHAIMTDNKEILKSKLQYADDDFIPGKEVAEYAFVRKELQDLLDVISKDYRWPDTDENVPEGSFSEAFLRTDGNTKVTEDWMSRYERLGMHVIARSVDLNRNERFVTDGILKEEQCEELLSLAKDLIISPIGSRKFDLKVAKQTLDLIFIRAVSGFPGNSHRLEDDPSEDFEASLRLFVRVAEVVRHYTQRYLELTEHMFLKDTSIVCWSGSPETTENNGCYPQEDGTCVRFEDMSDELYSDAYTTVTYLNTADEDGDFQYLNEKSEVDMSLGVKCGRTVGFNTGDRHTMKVPKKDEPRCAMVIRYTLLRSHDNKDYHDTLTLLKRVDELRLASSTQSAKDVMKRFEDEGVRIVKNGEELVSKERFVADGLASEAQCSTLRNMVQELGLAGEGYNGRTSPLTVNEIIKGLSLIQINQNGALLGDGYDHLFSKPSFISPHTKHELYQGITIYRASKLAQQNMISVFGLKSFLELSENSRLFVEKYLNLSKPLYFDYTHLVCRTAVDENKNDRADLSHPVHADNCLLQPDGSCVKDYPAFIQRDYSAILYLNEDFEGGEFFFAYSNQTEQVSVSPKCGRLVGFNAGEFHGVKAVKRGQRCALALWFTHNPNFKELAHIQARKTLKEIEDRHRMEEKPVHEDL